MKFATFRNGTADGQLLLVSRDLSHCVTTLPIVVTLSDALRHWPSVQASLQSLSDELNAGQAMGMRHFEGVPLLAPLPKPAQWCVGSAFDCHRQLLTRANQAGLVPTLTPPPLMYRGNAEALLGPIVDVDLPYETLGIDFEGGFAVAVGPVPAGCRAGDAAASIRLVMQCNTWTLRQVGAEGAGIDFDRGAERGETASGDTQSCWTRPVTSFAPVAVTPDELGCAWHDGRVDLALHVAVNGQRFGKPHGREMSQGFPDLVALAARVRGLGAGSLVGCGVVSNVDRGAGTASIAERRCIEFLVHGSARTPYLRFGDRVRMTARDATIGAPFGAMEQAVVRSR